jgi:flavodoxin
MKIGIIVYSYTGHTLSAAQKLEEAIKAAGHSANLERVEPVVDNPNSNDPVQLKSSPDVTQYEAVVFASPVHAFSLSRVMKLYLSQLPDMTGKKVHCFVTQQLKWPWMGGNRAVRQITEACRAKGADVISGGVVNWSGKDRDSQIDDIVRRMSVF